MSITDVKLYCADALDVLRRLPALSCDALITDPPYANGQTVSDRAASTAAKLEGYGAVGVEAHPGIAQGAGERLEIELSAL